MKIRKRLAILSVLICILLLCYILGYLYFVHPMPVRLGASSNESVEPVFSTAKAGIIGLFRPAVAVDQDLFPGRWELERFQLPPTDLAGLRKLSPFQARVESVGRTMPYNTGISTLHMGLRLQDGHLLQVDQPQATDRMFAIAGALMDTQIHEFPKSWFDTK
jgi:hypothetical protein